MNLGKSKVKTVQDQLRQEQLRIVLDDSVPAVNMTLVVMLFCAVTLYPTIPHTYFSYWLIAGLSVVVARLLFSNAYLARRDSPDFTLERWCVANNVMVFLSGSVWGSLIFFFETDLPMATQVTLVLFPVGMAAAAVSSYGAWPSTYIAYITPCIFPTAVAFTLNSSGDLTTIAATTFFYVTCLMFVGQNFRNRIVEVIQLRLNNDKLVDDLSMQNQHLTIAIEDAEAANRAKTEFLARMSHEIRTPLNGVLGMTHLMESTELSERQQHVMDSIHTSGTALLEIINDLLDISRIEAERLELEVVPMLLRETVEQLESMLSDAANRKGVALNCHVDDAMPEWILGDPVRLKQILTNLLSNAIKFTHQGSVSLYVDAIGMRGNKQTLRFKVVDTGIGIKRESLGMIFDAFSQADGSTTRKFGGTGLGLAIAQQLAELMRGQITVESEPGEGSEFTFVGEFGQCSEQVIQQVVGESDSDRQANAAPGSDSLEGTQILLVEDSPINREVAVAMLEQMGCEVSVAGDGAQAVKRLFPNNPHQMEGDFDVVLMDCQMPIMDGYQATRKIRDREGSNSSIPIIALTANAMKGDREKCIEAGMDDYLSKPFQPRDLLNVISKLVTTSSAKNEHEKGNGDSGEDCETESDSKEPTSILDPEVVDRLIALDRGNGLLHRVVEAFHGSVPALIEDLRSGLASGDLSRIRLAAHTLKSSAANLGAMTLSEMGFSLEQMAGDKDMSGAEPVLDKLDMHLPLVLAELDGLAASINVKKSA